MKTIGLIGGMSWESSIEYYRIINERVNRKLGGLHSAKIIMFSLNFYEIEQLQNQGRWGEATDIIVNVSKKLENAGAELILICTNTMHMMANQVESNIKVPLLHITDVLAEEIKSKGLKKIGLLGTKFTMEQDFYKKILKDHGIEVIVPKEDERTLVNKIIYDELCVGKIIDSSRQRLIIIIRELVKMGAEGIALACTELPLLIRQKDTNVIVFDTCRLHAEKAVEIALHSD